MLLSDEDSQDIIKSAAIIDDNNDDVEEDDIQVVVEHITRRITVKIESSENLQKKKASTVANVLEKVRESALSSLKSSDKTVKNKAAAFEDSAPAKNFNACKADDHEDSSSSEDEQPQSPLRLQAKVSHKSPAKRAKAGDQKHWSRPKKSSDDEVDEDIHKSQRLKEQIACSPSKKGFIANTALVDMHSLIEKLISRVHFVQPTESEEPNVNNMVEALSEKDIRSTKFINLARQLRDDELDDEEQGNLIRLANTKISVTKMIKLRCMAVLGKAYVNEFKHFKEGYCSPKVANVKGTAKITWKRYVKLVYGVSYSTVKRAQGVFMICAQFPALCWCEIAPSNLYDSQAKVFRDALSDCNLYKRLEKKVQETFEVRII